MLVIFSIFFTSTTYAQKKSFKNGTVKPKSYFEEINFEFEKNKIVVPVKIDGKEYRFLLDTGAPNIISKELYETLNIKENRLLTTSDANEIKQDLKIVSLKKLELGDVVFQNFAALVFDLNGSDIFKCFEIDGFIGSNLLRHSIIQIDAKNKVLKLTDNIKRLKINKQQSQKIKFADNQHRPYIWINVKGEDNGREMVLVDTGKGGLYDITKDNYKIFRSKKIYNEIGNSDGASSVSLFGEVPVNNQTRVHLPKLVVNGFHINNIITHTSKGDNSKLGAELLNYGIMTLDYKGKRFYFDSYQESIDLDGDFGFTQTIQNNKLVIGYVWDDTLKSKISYGDEILEVNGNEVNIEDFCNYIIKESVLKTANTLELKVKKEDDSVIKLKVKKKPISLILENNN